MSKTLLVGFGGLVGLMLVAVFSFILQELEVTNDSCWWNATGPTVMLIPFLGFVVTLVVGFIITIRRDDF